MRICWRAIAVRSSPCLTAANALLPTTTEQHEPDIDMFASMAGKCTSVKVADRDFVCTSVAFFHSPGGRSSFTVPLNDPDDDSHIITFSGDKAKRDQDVYDLTIDRMLLKSKDRPKLDGLPVPRSCWRTARASRSEISPRNRCPASPARRPTPTA